MVSPENTHKWNIVETEKVIYTSDNQGQSGHGFEREQRRVWKDLEGRREKGK